MVNRKVSRSVPNQNAGEENLREIKETFNKAKSDIAVKNALKKETQPVNPGDLSHLHNTREIGTTGGDQRASESELKQAGETAGDSARNKEKVTKKR